MATDNSNSTKKFLFVSHELSPDLFKVVRFTGTEGIHNLFSLVIELVSRDSAVDTDSFLHSRATFTILRENGDPVVFNGYPARVEQGGTFNGYTYYTVELCPSFWKLRQLVQSRIFLDANLQETIKELLISHKFFALANEFRFTRQDYPKPEFAMQHEESVYDYICWRLEEQGAYYFIAQKPGFDTLVFGDSPQSHTPLESTPTLFYSPATGLEGTHVPEVLTSFILHQQPVPHQVAIRTYNWKSPEKPVVGIAPVSPLGIGDVYLTNEEVTTDGEAQRLATIRAEQILAGQRQYYGQSAAPTLRPGYTFTLSRHYSEPFNLSYLITSVMHEGSQEAFLSLGLGIPMHNVTDHHFYRNSFTCIHDDTVFRPARTAPRNKVSGIIRAFVDGSTSGARPELDEYGHYKILFPFDISGRKQGNASCWVRMAQQQVGNNSGASFPLLPGTEVTVGFLDGNPNSPIITGVLANGQTGSLTTGANNEISGIRTAGGNQLTFNDTDTHQGISMMLPSGQGLNFSSGSLGSATATTDFWLSGASNLSTEVTGFTKNLTSGFKVSQSAGFKKASKITMLVIKALSKITDSNLSAYAPKSNDPSERQKFQRAADGVKVSALLINMILEMTWGEGLNVELPSYGASLSADEKSGKMSLQILPTKGELAASVIMWLVGELASIGLTLGKGGNEYENSEEQTVKNNYLEKLNNARKALYNYDNSKYKDYATDLTGDPDDHHCSQKNAVSKQLDELITKWAFSKDSNEKTKRAEFKILKAELDAAWKTLCNDDIDNKNYYETVHKNAIHKAGVSSLSELLPELTSYIALFMGMYKGHNRNNARLGGISINSKDSNVNIKAKLPVSLCSDSGILVNTRTKDADATATRVRGEVKTFGDWGRPGGTHLTQPQPLAPINKLHEAWKDFLQINDNMFTRDNGSAITKAALLAENTFIADVTDLAYTEGKYGMELFDREHYASAKKHFLSSGKTNLTLAESTNNNEVSGGATLELSKLDARRSDACGGYHQGFQFRNHRLCRWSHQDHRQRRKGQ